MSDNKKVWVIDDGKRPELTSLGDPIQSTTRPQSRPVAGRSPQRPAPSTRPVSAAPRLEKPPYRPVQTALLVLLAYAAGPASPLLSGRGRRGRATLALTAAGILAAALIAGGWWAVRTGRLGDDLLPWLVFATAPAAALAFTAWARGVQLVAGSHRVAAHPWSPRLTGPWTAALLGLVAPGGAQVLARRSFRAATTLWGAWPFVAAAVLALQAPLLWARRAAFASWGLDASAVEQLLIAAAVLTVLAPLLWLAQALEGARVLAARAGRWQQMRGDWCAVALVAALAAAAVINDPGTLAAGLSDYAGDLAGDGLTTTPLLMVQAARHLDPGQPAYALQEADLYVAAGAEARARQVRSDLDRALQPYLGALLREGRDARALPVAANGAAGLAATLSRGPSADDFLMPTRDPVRRPAGPPSPRPGVTAASVP